MIVKHWTRDVGEVVEVVHPAGKQYVAKHWEYKDVVSPPYSSSTAAANWVTWHEVLILWQDDYMADCRWIEEIWNE